TNISSGNPYIRESFNSVFCGGELTAHKMQHWVRAAMRIEPFTTGMNDHQHDFFRVGYRCRTANRNHGVSMRWRRIASGASKPAFGDSTPATASFTLSSDPTGETITLTDYAGTAKTFEFGFNSGPNVEVPAPVDPLSVEDWIGVIVNAINNQGASFRMTATDTGSGTMSIAQDAARPEINTATAYGARPITYSTKSVWSVAPDNFRTESLVDSYGRYMGPASAGGTNVQYFYDAESNCEIWFWHRFNLWNKPSTYVGGTDAYLDTGSDDAWGTWYGAARNDTGLVVWALNFVPDRDSNNVYQYGDGTSSDQVYYTQMYPTKTEAATGVIGYFSEEGGSIDPSTGETTSGDHGYEYVEEYKGNSIQYPLWANASDGSDTVNLNTIRTNRLGMLWHSQQVNFSPTRTTEISGEPKEFWPKMAPIWRPRGDAVSGETTRDTSILTVT
ncbi:MAG: hypothetical protein ACO3O3_13535, partial [Ilumatobacteraceae bacterium]